MITVDRIGKSFGDRTVLRGMSMLLHPKELVGVIGSSGSGKTTLLRCINGLELLDDGSIDVDQFRIESGRTLEDAQGAALRRRVGLVFQHLNLWPYRTALENIIEGPRFCLGMRKAEAVERAVQWARKLGIEDHLHKYPSQLSGGQRQRVALARAAANEPAYLLLDEITSSLDPILAGEIADIIVQLKDQGMGLIVVSHQIDFIRRNADRVYFLHGGTVCESGPPESLLSEPTTPELREFIQLVRHGW